MNSKFNKIKEEKIEFELNDFSKKEKEKEIKKIQRSFYLSNILIKNDNNQLFYLNCNNYLKN